MATRERIPPRRDGLFQGVGCLVLVRHAKVCITLSMMQQQLADPYGKVCWMSLVDKKDGSFDDYLISYATHVEALNATAHLHGRHYDGHPLETVALSREAALAYTEGAHSISTVVQGRPVDINVRAMLGTNELPVEVALLVTCMCAGHPPATDEMIRQVERAAEVLRNNQASRLQQPTAGSDVGGGPAACPAQQAGGGHTRPGVGAGATAHAAHATAAPQPLYGGSHHTARNAAPTAGTRPAAAAQQRTLDTSGWCGVLIKGVPAGWDPHTLVAVLKEITMGGVTHHHTYKHGQKVWLAVTFATPLRAHTVVEYLRRARVSIELTPGATTTGSGTSHQAPGETGNNHRQYSDPTHRSAPANHPGSTHCPAPANHLDPTHRPAPAHHPHPTHHRPHAPESYLTQNPASGHLAIIPYAPSVPIWTQTDNAHHARTDHCPTRADHRPPTGYPGVAAARTAAQYASADPTHYRGILVKALPADADLQDFRMQLDRMSGGILVWRQHPRGQEVCVSITFATPAGAQYILASLQHLRLNVALVPGASTASAADSTHWRATSGDLWLSMLSLPLTCTPDDIQALLDHLFLDDYETLHVIKAGDCKVAYVQWRYTDQLFHAHMVLEADNVQRGLGLDISIAEWMMPDGGGDSAAATPQPLPAPPPAQVVPAAAVFSVPGSNGEVLQCATSLAAHSTEDSNTETQREQAAAPSSHVEPRATAGARVELQHRQPPRLPTSPASLHTAAGQKHPLQTCEEDSEVAPRMTSFKKRRPSVGVLTGNLLVIGSEVVLAASSATSSDGGSIDSQHLQATSDNSWVSEDNQQKVYVVGNEFEVSSDGLLDAPAEAPEVSSGGQQEAVAQVPEASRGSQQAAQAEMPEASSGGQQGAPAEGPETSSDARQDEPAEASEVGNDGQKEAPAEAPEVEAGYVAAAKDRVAQSKAEEVYTCKPGSQLAGQLHEGGIMDTWMSSPTHFIMVDESSRASSVAGSAVSSKPVRRAKRSWFSWLGACLCSSGQ